jgi:hypothetical protein
MLMQTLRQLAPDRSVAAYARCYTVSPATRAAAAHSRHAPPSSRFGARFISLLRVIREVVTLFEREQRPSDGR